MDIEQELQKKWGEFSAQEHYVYQLHLPFISEKALFNLLFFPQSEQINKTVFREFGCELPDGLKKFYEKYNGCRLFFSSLSIYGLQQYTEDVYEPYDIVRENLNAQSSFQDERYVFFASLGGKYLFAFRKDELTKIYTVESGKRKILRVYEDFGEWFSHFFYGLMAEYDLTGRKVHPNGKYKKYPVLYHLTYDLF